MSIDLLWHIYKHSPQNVKVLVAQPFKFQRLVHQACIASLAWQMVASHDRNIEEYLPSHWAAHKLDSNAHCAQPIVLPEGCRHDKLNVADYNDWKSIVRSSGAHSAAPSLQQSIRQITSLAIAHMSRWQEGLGKEEQGQPHHRLQRNWNACQFPLSMIIQ